MKDELNRGFVCRSTRPTAGTTHHRFRSSLNGFGNTGVGGQLELSMGSSCPQILGRPSRSDNSNLYTFVLIFILIYRHY
jgi:hypothetical protein